MQTCFWTVEFLKLCSDSAPLRFDNTFFVSFPQTPDVFYLSKFNGLSLKMCSIYLLLFCQSNDYKLERMTALALLTLYNVYFHTNRLAMNSILYQKWLCSENKNN